MDPSPALHSCHRPLGNTGIAVSPIGLGTVKLGRNTGVKYPTSFDLPSDPVANRVLETARDLGVNLIDTAPAYGVAERRLGRLLPGPRDEWVIVTKAGEEYADGKSRFDFSLVSVTASVLRSLKRLRVDVLDAVLIHSDGRDTEIITGSGGGAGGALEALERLKHKGYIRACGISTKTLEGALLAVARGLDVVMLTLNPLHIADLPAIEAARTKGVGVLVKKALVSGHVGDHAADRTLTPEHCIDFALSTPGVTSVVVGTIDADHLRADATAALHSLQSSRSNP